MLSPEAVKSLIAAGASNHTVETAPQVWYLDANDNSCRQASLVGFWRGRTIIAVGEIVRTVQDHLVFSSSTEAYIASATHQKERIDQLTREYTGTLSAAHEFIRAERDIRSALMRKRPKDPEAARPESD